MHLGLDRPQLVHRLADDVEHATQRGLAHGHLDRLAGVLGRHAADQAVGGYHRHAAHPVLAQVLLDLGDDVQRDAGLGARVLDVDRVVDGRQVLVVELDVDHGTDDLNHASDLAHRLLPF